VNPFADVQAIAEPATYLIAGGAMALEFGLLRHLEHPIDHRSGWVSLASGGLAFGGLALAYLLLYVPLMHVLWRHRLFDLGGGWAAWGAAFLLYDLMFYVAHRAGHEIRILWCFHSVHHTPEEMRLTTAVRGSALDWVYLPWFYIWLPLLGFHPSMVLIVEAGGRIWGVLVHVSPRLVGRLGALDRWWITPSAHRVHHATELPYLDRNYGEVLIIWDRLFGTFAPQTGPTTFGVLSPIDSRRLSAVQLDPWRALWADLKRAPSWRIRLRYLFDAPGYTHDGSDTRVKTLRAQGTRSSGH
jgi:sterol desaturase/sphingolipid hydroxylase (fatty acid hydroxylase superfamily)